MPNSCGSGRVDFPGPAIDRDAIFALGKLRRDLFVDHGTAWADQWPMSKWTRDRDLTFVLRHIHDELSSVGYVGI